MRVSLITAALCAVASVGVALNPSAAQNPAGPRFATATPAVEQKPKFSFILFWKENNPATQTMAGGAENGRGPAVRARRVDFRNVNDAAQRAIVERYHVECAPMPMVVCTAPNGVVTGAIMRQVTDQAIDNLLVTPGMAELAKTLQEKRIAVIHVQADPRQPLPAGAAAFVADPAFNARTTVFTVALTDPDESRFVAQMEIKPEQTAESTIVVIAPPGVLVGKFPAAATANQIGAALHAAGKCCNDPNCKHNQKGK